MGRWGHAEQDQRSKRTGCFFQPKSVVCINEKFFFHLPGENNLEYSSDQAVCGGNPDITSSSSSEHFMREVRHTPESKPPTNLLSRI